MGFTIDATGVEPLSGGEMIEPGNYTARIREAKETESSTPGLNVVFEVDAGPQKGAKVRDTVWMTAKALPYALGRFEAAGVKLTGQTDSDALCRALIGKRVEIIVRPDEWTDRDGNIREGRKVVAWDKPQGSTTAGLPGVEMAGAPTGAANDSDLPF